MEFNEIIRKTASILRLEELTKYYDDETMVLTAQGEKDLELLSSCINIIASEIATEYVLLEKREKITVVDGEFDLTKLLRKCFRVLSVDGKKDFYIFENKLIANDGKYEILYNYIPLKRAPGGRIDDFDDKINDYTFYYAVASQYCLILGNYSEAEMWRSKFEISLRNAQRSNKVYEIKKRRWC